MEFDTSSVSSISRCIDKGTPVKIAPFVRLYTRNSILMKLGVGEIIERWLNRISVPLGWIILTVILGRTFFYEWIPWVTCNAKDGTDR
jgi:hypothetical protein